MKKNHKIFLITFMLLICFFSAYSVAAENKAVEEIMAWEIMIGDENGNFNPEKMVSRAEFCTIIMRSHGYEDWVGVDSEAPFVDVPKEHWAYGNINTLYKLQIVNGINETHFAPDGNVTLEQAVKILVSSMGYTIEAEKKGGYPSGYMAVATKNGLLKGVNTDNDKYLTREETAVLIYNALDVPMLVQNYGTNPELYVDEKVTIRKIREYINERQRGEGIITGAGNTFVNADLDEEDTYVEIDGELFLTEGKDYSDYIGMEVNFFYDYGSNEPRPKVKTIIPTNLNSDIKISSKDVVAVDMNTGKIKFKQNGGKNETVFIASDASFIYNGKFEYMIDESDFSIGYGDIRLVDNNRDRKYDYVFINSYEVLVVKELSASQNVILLKNERKNGARSIALSNDDEYTYILSKNGEKCEITEISDDNIIVARISLDEKYTIMDIIEPEIITGKVTTIDDAGKEFGIDDEMYEYVNANSMSHIDDIVLGESFTFYINDNKIVYFTEDLGGKERYCYFLESELQRSIGGKCIIRAVFDNQVMELYCADKTKVDGIKCNGKEVQEKLQSGKVYKLSFNSKNEVNKIESADITGKRNDRRYHSTYRSFRDLYKPFRMDEDTTIFMIPTNPDACDEDYLTSPDLKHNAFLECEAYEVDEETQIAKVVVIYGVFSYEGAGYIVKSSTASIVDNVKYIYNEELDGMEAVVGLYQYGEYLKIPVRDDQTILNIVDSLKTGDVIFYSLNTLGKMDNIKIIATDIMNMDIQKNGFTDDKGWMMGYVSRCKKDWMNQNSNIVSNILYLSLYQNGIEEQAFVLETDVENQIDSPMYCIDMNLGTVYPITVDDIISMEDTGSVCDKAYAYSINSATQVVVVIKE